MDLVPYSDRQSPDKVWFLVRLRHLAGDVYEFKVHRAVAVRYLAFRTRAGWVIARAQRKCKKAALQRAILDVQRIRDEYERSGS